MRLILNTIHSPACASLSSTSRLEEAMSAHISREQTAPRMPRVRHTLRSAWTDWALVIATVVLVWWLVPLGHR